MFDVYVDGATVASHDALVALAAAIALRHGGSANDLAARLMRGPLQMATGVASERAYGLRRDLEALGARVRVQPSDPGADSGASPDPARDPHRPGAAPIDRRTSLPPAASPSRFSELPPIAPSAVDARPIHSSLPSPVNARPMRSSLPAAVDARPLRSSLPAAVDARPLRSSLPAAVDARPMHSSLPAAVDARPIHSSLPSPVDARPIHSSLPSAVDARPIHSSLPPQPAHAVAPVLPPAPASRATRSSLAPGAMPLPAPADPPRSMRSSLPPQPSPRPIAPSLPPPWERLPGDPAPTWAASGDARSPSPSSTPVAVDAIAAPAADWSLDPIPEPDLDEDSRPDPEPAPLPASIGPPVPRASAPELSWPGIGDPFRAPALATAEPALELAELPRASRTILEQPPATGRPGPDRGSTDREAAARVVRRATPATPQIVAAVPVRTDGAVPAAAPGSNAADPAGRVTRLAVRAPGRVRLAAGVLLAIGLGFVPAHVVADLRERHAFAAIDAAVVARQAAADTPALYAALDAFRAEQRAAKRSARREFALASLAIWAATSGVFAYGWFRRSPGRQPR